MEIAEDLQTKELIDEFKLKEQNAEVCTVILKVENSNFEKKPYDIKLFGKTMLEWVSNAVFDTKIVYANLNPNDDVISTVKSAADINSKYTFVLFSDTPLFQRKSYLEILEYFKMKQYSVLKLTRGFVFETKYLFEIENLLNPQIEYFDEEDFITAIDYKQVAMISEILKNRILSYFMKKGVFIFDPATTYIDADCQISKGTVIYPFNIIMGQSIIESNVTLNSYNRIDESVVCENSVLDGAFIKDSFIGKNAKIAHNATIENNAKICDNVVVPNNCNINGVNIDCDVKLKSFYTYKSEE